MKRYLTLGLISWTNCLKARSWVSTISISRPLSMCLQDNTGISGVVWHDLKVEPAELRPDLTLIIGQTFCWRRLELDGKSLEGLGRGTPIRDDDRKSSSGPDTTSCSSSCFVGVVDGHPLAIKQTPNTTLFALLSMVPPIPKEVNKLRRLLWDYFQLEFSLVEVSYDLHLCSGISITISLVFSCISLPLTLHLFSCTFRSFQSSFMRDGLDRVLV
jgi:hypothetical protein